MSDLSMNQIGALPVVVDNHDRRDATAPYTNGAA